MSDFEDYKNVLNKNCQLEDNILVNNCLKKGYWSNLNKEENRELIEEVKRTSPKIAIKKMHPWLEDVIFSKKREAGLELLNLKGDEVCIDFGCMWGALSVPLSKRTKLVIAADQTIESLEFLRERKNHENISNLILLNTDIKQFPTLENLKIDIAVVNGVLEWIPEKGSIELKKYYGKKNKKIYGKFENPINQQKEFLTNVKGKIKKNGKLYLAIENRYDFKMFFGVNDPHSNLLLTSVLPKRIANIISKIFLGRPYVNWIYSKKELENLLKELGFKNIQTYFAFPDYRFPEIIIHSRKDLKNFYPTIQIKDKNNKLKVKRLFGFIIEYIIFKIFKLKKLAPSFIVIAEV